MSDVALEDLPFDELRERAFKRAEHHLEHSELEGQGDAFYDCTQRRLETLSRKLLAWNQGPARAAVLLVLLGLR